MTLKTFAEIKPGDSCNDADCKYPAGHVTEVRTDEFTAEWVRFGVRYIKNHPREDLDSGKLIAW